MKQKSDYHFQKAPYLGFVAENNNCGLHLHRQVEISYILEGEQIFMIEDKAYELREGDLIVVFPNQLHRLITSNYCKAVTSIFDANLTHSFTQKLTRHQFKQCVFHKDELKEASLAAISELEKTGISKSYKAHLIPYTEKGLLTVLLTDLFAEHETIVCPPESSTVLITSFFNYIEAHYQEKLSLEQIADALGISTSHLAACILQGTGRTPHMLLTIRRLDEARTLLRKTNLSVAEIAEKTGFQSSRSFYRNFVDAYDKTPLKYRQHKAREELEKKKNKPHGEGER